MSGLKYRGQVGCDCAIPLVHWKLPGQSAFVRIGTAPGTTSQTRRPTFTDATVPAEHLSAEAQGAQYIVQGARATCVGEASDVLVVQFGADGTILTLATLERAA